MGVSRIDVHPVVFVLKYARRNASGLCVQMILKPDVPSLRPPNFSLISISV